LDKNPGQASISAPRSDWLSPNETDLDATIPLVSVGNLMGASDGAALTAQQLLMQTNVIVHCIGAPQQ
jgi:hypothetical protein